MPTYHSGGSLIPPVNVFVGVGGTVSLTPAAGVTNARIYLAGVATTWNISGPTSGTLIVNNTVAVGSDLNITTNGAAVTLDSSVLTGTVFGTVDTTINGGSLTVGSDLLNAGVLSGASVTFAPPGGTNIVGTTGSFVTVDLLTAFAPYKGFTTPGADNIDDVNLNFGLFKNYTISGTLGGTQTIVVTDTDGTSLSFKTAGTSFADNTYTSETTGPLLLTNDGHNGTNITPNAVCFLRGTRIGTLEGEPMVETLKVGDLVATQTNAGTRFRPVKWLGYRRIDLTAHPRPETVAPVCIRRSAFAENMPHSDLFLSPDHAIFAEGRLICARQLVNGTTIRRVTGLASVEYFHVELDEHAILSAEGLPTESYLDSGNRGFFANSTVPFKLHPDLTDEGDNATREIASCAPFVWDEDNVRPVWEALAERAASLGQPVPTPDTTEDAQLCIVTQGRTQRPINVANGRHCFFVPKGETEIRVVSRSASPTVARPWMEDHRRLGVYVERIVLHSGDELQEIPLDDPGLSQGWWAPEGSGMMLRRWTDGGAILPLPIMGGPIMLEIHAGNSGMAYLTADAGKQRQAA